MVTLKLLEKSCTSLHNSFICTYIDSIFNILDSHILTRRPPRVVYIFCVEVIFNQQCLFFSPLPIISTPKSDDLTVNSNGMTVYVNNHCTVSYLPCFEFLHLIYKLNVSCLPVCLNA